MSDGRPRDDVEWAVWQDAYTAALNALASKDEDSEATSARCVQHANRALDRRRDAEK